jgi:hypothetical protein
MLQKSALEVARLQSMLDERSPQVAILTGTVESLQSAFALTGCGGDPGHNSDSSIDNSTSSSLIDGDNNDSSSIQGSSSSNEWGIQTISERVVALTSELSTSTAVSAMMEHRAEQLTREVQQRAKLCSFLEAKLKVYAEEHGKHQSRARTTADEHNRFVSTDNRELSRASNENNAVRRSLRQTEVKLKDA